MLSGLNVGGLNFFFIGDDNLLTANNIGTGLQGVIAGDENQLAGNQVILPTSFGINFVSMGDRNGNLAVASVLIRKMVRFELGRPRRPIGFGFGGVESSDVGAIGQQSRYRRVQLRQQHGTRR